MLTTTVVVVGFFPLSHLLLLSMVQVQGEESHRHPVLCTHQRSRERGKGGIHEQLQAVMDKLQRRDLKILMSDLNANVGPDNTNRELIMGKH